MHSILFRYTALLALAAHPLDISGAEAPEAQASLRIHSARVSRNTSEFNKRFAGRYYGDNNPGVNMQLLLTLNEGVMLPVTRDAVSIDMFVDDTYQSLLSTGNEYQSGTGQTVLSDDARTLLFTVDTKRTPANEAGRVFVRGSVRARVSKDEPAVATNKMPMIVGEEALIGDFRTVVRSVSDQGASGVSVQIAIEGDPVRIQKIRALDSGGKVLNDERQGRMNSFADANDRPATAYLYLKAVPKEPIIIEYTYVKKADPLQIPFEAQVDIGVTKAGPIELRDGKAPKANEIRPWPPREKGDVIPPRRGAFDPDDRPPTATTNRAITKLERTAVDLFSVTVAKPAPSEARGAAWNNPPSPNFYASGFTIARLMLSTPGAAILSIPSDGILVSRFEDDKGGRLDTALYRDSGFSKPGWPSLLMSPDGQQALLNLSLVATPTPGAMRCTLAGRVQAKVARGDHTHDSEKLELRNGEKFVAGPFKGSVVNTRQVAPLTPSGYDGSAIEITVSMAGPLSRLRSLELYDGAQALVASRSNLADLLADRSEYSNIQFRLSTTPKGPVTLRTRHYDRDEMVEVPFELSMGIGL